MVGMTERIAEKTAQTSVPILPELQSRWSPRAFDPARPVTDEQVTAMFEAARWSPSAFNAQPWRFVAARIGTPRYTQLLGRLMEFNRAWVCTAPLIVVNIAKTVTDDGTPFASALYDLGQAVAQYSVQARAEGLYVHQMTGIDAAGIAADLGLAEGERVFTVSAVGVPGDPSQLPEKLQERETQPRDRLALEHILLERP